MSLRKIYLPALLLAAPCVCGAQVWTVRVEEPTGLDRRTGEVVRVPLAKLGGNRGGFTVLDGKGRESPWQVSGEDLLFQVSVVPGELPLYRVSCCLGGTPKFANQIHYRKIGMRRIEFGNSRFRMVVDTGVPAIVEAYSLTAGPERAVNLVETSPEDPRALKDDIHLAERKPWPPVPGVQGENTGWSTLGGTGTVTSVEVVSVGPLEGRIRLARAGETQEFEWMANSPGVRWKAAKGFRFAAISAAPFLPFDRYLDTPETVAWPDVSSTTEPDGHDIGPRPYRKLPAGHAVYYQLAANYGALGIVALDPDLEFTGIGSRKFVAEKPQGEAEIGITFPRWDGFRTLLEARRENRVMRQPLLARVDAPAEGPAPEPLVRAALEPEYTVAPNAPEATPFREESMTLDGDWELAWCEKGCDLPAGGWRTVKVPGTVHVEWLGAAKSMTREAEWISYKEWWYRRKFQVPQRYAGKRLRLAFEATDYYADTWIDGRFIGRHEGYIDPYEYDVTDAVKAGTEHEIRVRVWTPVSYYWRHRPYTVKGSYGAVDQKPDDITALGITRPVKLIASAPGILRDVAIDTRLGEGDSAEVEVELEADGAEEGYRWELTLEPRNFASPAGRYRAEGRAGRGRARFVIPVRHPQLWWTWDHGKPNLYTLEVRLLGPGGRAVDGRSIAVGIREIEKIGWRFYLNRRRMFIRGTNYYYNLFLSEMNRERYARDLKLMLGMNVNMIRLHCHYSNPEFYDLADEQGVLIWQDYLEAWYPEDTAFSVRAAKLYDHHVRYVRNHPSVALWATSDEESLENYRDLTKHLAARPAFLDPQRRPVVRSTGRYGDAHVYYGWYGGSVWQYTKMTEDFVSELGATSLPNYETLIQFLPDAWPIRDHQEEWIWRKLQIPEAMRAWGEPGNLTLKEYIPRTQAYVARLFQIALERSRRRKSEGAGGILHFHAIDIWPSLTMAAIDIDRVPTKTYYVVRHSFEPVLASIEYDRDKWRTGETVRCGLWAINDGWEAIPGARIDWRIVNGNGAAQRSGTLAAAMEADSSRQVGAVEWIAGAPGAYELRAAVVDSAGKTISENLFEFEVIP
jgi:beta-mannosidase